MSSSQLSQGGLIRLVFTRVILLIPLLFAMFFLPAGTFAYWEAWLYLAILLIPMSFVLLYLLKNDPGLLERRMRLRERETEQKRIVITYTFFFILAFLLPGFDHRFGWSHAPVAVVLAADILVLLGYGMFFLVLRENSYASRIVEVEKEQKVISSGPYALVRHPMYLGISVLSFFSPLALGSWWAIIPALMIFPILVERIRSEETVLARDLQGYQEYMHKTRYRLIPGIW